MKRFPTRRRGILRVATALVLGPLALTAAGVVASPRELGDWIGGDASSPETLLELHASLRNLLELVIVFLQLGAVAALCLWKLAQAGRWGDLGRNAFVGSMIGLGIGGTLCAGYCSPFALYSGGTMAVLLIVNAIGSGPPAANRFRPACVPVIMTR